MATLDEIRNGGWLWELGGKFDNATDARIMTGSQLDGASDDVLAYYSEYAKRNFSEDFIPGMGSEDVLRILAACGPRRRWLDVGAGTSSWFWALAVDCTGLACLADVRIEPLIILERTASDRAFPSAYQQAAAFARLPRDAAETAVSWPRQYALFDAMASWPEQLGSFDLVTMIGLCGLRTEDGIYTAELAGAREHLTADGIVVGVDWRRSAAFAEADGHANAFISPALLKDRARRLGLDVVTCRMIDVIGDPLYDSMMVWVVR